MSKHKPCGFGYHIVCFDDKLYSLEPVIYRADNKGEDVVQMFIKMLEVNLKKTHKELDFAEKMIFTDEDRHEFNNATHCWICKG